MSEVLLPLKYVVVGCVSFSLVILRFVLAALYAVCTLD